MKKFVILFAGVPGSSKTPIAYYLSCHFGWPIFNNDTIRTEVTEDLGSFDQKEYLKRRDERLGKLLDKGGNFILDASIDRIWDELKPKLSEHDYEYFIINIELSKEFAEKLYKNKGYHWALEYIDQLFDEHQKLLAKVSVDIDLNISESDFSNRLEIARKAVESWL